MLKQLIEYTIKTLVESPSSVKITETNTPEKDIFEVKVGEQDVGKVIGKEGQTIRALRMLLIAVAPEGREIDIIIEK